MSLFRSRHDEEEYEEDRDFFSGPDLPDPPRKEPKKPVLRPDNPDYWEQDESEWEHLKPSRRTALWVWVAIALVGAGLLIFFWLHFLSPYREAAVQYGYVESIETRGKVFKTIEGKLLPYKELMDTTRVYRHDFDFSVTDKKVAAVIYDLMEANKPVRVTYKEYTGVLPWRGETGIIVVSAQEADPRKILPPEYHPKGVGEVEPLGIR